MDRARRRLVVILGLLISAVLLWLALRGLDIASLVSVMQQTRPGWLLAASLLTIFGLWLRSVRWRNLVAQDDIPLSVAFAINSIGYLGNFVLPARAGELLRSVLMGRYSGVGTSQVLAVSLSERVLDALTLVVVVLLSMSALADPGIRRAAVLMTAVCVAVLSGLLVLARQREWALVGLSRLPLPNRLRMQIEPPVSRFLDGLEVFRSGRRLKQFGLFTAIIWVMDGVMAIFLARAFGLTFTWPQAVLLLATLGLASAVPSAPGYIGVYQFVAVTVLIPLHYSQAEAVVYVTALQAIGYLVVLVCGSWGLLRLNLNTGGLWKLFCQEETIAHEIYHSF